MDMLSNLVKMTHLHFVFLFVDRLGFLLSPLGLFPN